MKEMQAMVADFQMQVDSKMQQLTMMMEAIKVRMVMHMALDRSSQRIWVTLKRSRILTMFS